MQLDLACCYSVRHMPLTALGYGRSAAADKSASTCHILLLESGCPAVFEQIRREVRGWTSDRDVERLVVDGPCLHPSSLAEWEAKVADLHHKGFALNDIQGCSLYLFPFAMYQPDMLHQMFGALENSVCKNAAWSQIEGYVRSLSLFLSNSELRLRFHCFTKAEHRCLASLFNDWSTAHILWRWEYFEEFLGNLNGVLPVLVTVYDVELMKGDSARLHAKLIDDIRQALSYRPLALVCHLLCSLCRVVGEEARWCGGCASHEHVLHRCSIPARIFELPLEGLSRRRGAISPASLVRTRAHRCHLRMQRRLLVRRCRVSRAGSCLRSLLARFVGGEPSEFTRLLAASSIFFAGCIWSHARRLQHRSITGDRASVHQRS